MRRLISLLLLLSACDSVTDETFDNLSVPPIDSPAEAAPVFLAPKRLVPAPRRILIVGDSEACTVKYQVAKVKLATDTVDVDCKGGTVTDYWAKGGNFRGALSRHPEPDVVLVFLGTNDFWKKVAPDTGPITDLIHDRNLGCVWVGPTAVHGKQWPVNDMLRDEVTPTCEYFDTEYEDIPLWDGVHPDPAAAERWLRLIWKQIPLQYIEAP